MQHSIRGTRGLPYIGDAIALLRQPLSYVATHRRRFGDIWQTRFLGQRAVVAIGDEAQRAILEHEAQFPASVGYRFLAPILGHSLFTMDGHEHDTQRRLVTPAFYSSHYPAYLDRMNRVIARQCAQWGERGQRRFHREALAIMFAMACSLTIGLEPGTRYRSLLRRWLIMQRGTVDPFRVDVAGTSWHASLAARRWIMRFLQQTIDEHRQAETMPDDILTLFLTAQQANPDLTDHQIIEHLILLNLAGYDTTAGAISWLLLEVLRHPAVLARIQTEIHAEDIGAPARLEDIRQTPYLDATIRETLRLHPAQHIAVRGVAEDWTFRDVTVPAGWIVILVPAYTHRMAEYFAEPDQFRPERFLETKEGYPRGSLIEFGMGVHACLGANLAQVEMKAILIALLRRFSLRLLPHQKSTPLYLPAGRPKGGTQIAYRRLPGITDRH